MNYFLGIRQSDGVLVADFEDTANGGEPPRRRHDVDSAPAGVASRGGDLRRHDLAAVSRRPARARAGRRGSSRRGSTAFSTRRSGTALNSTGGVGQPDAGLLQRRAGRGAHLELRAVGRSRSAAAGCSRLRSRRRTARPVGHERRRRDGCGNSAGGRQRDGGRIGWTWVEGAPFTGANQAPVAADDLAATAEEAAATIAVLGNDSDADGDALTLASVSSAGARHRDRATRTGRSTLHAGGQLQRRRQLHLHDQRRPGRQRDGDRERDGDGRQRRAGGGATTRRRPDEDTPVVDRACSPTTATATARR